MWKSTPLRGVIVAVLGALLLAALAIRLPAEAGEVKVDTFTEGAMTLRIDGVPMEFDPAPYVLPPGRTMVPLRAVFENLGATVTWDGATRTVTATRGDRTIRMTVGAKTAYINSQAHQLDVAPEIRHDRTFIPLRFVAEGLQATVGYDQRSQEISVTSPVTPVETLALKQGMKMRFRLMMVRLVLHHHWQLVIDDAAAFPGPVTYRFEGSLAQANLPVMKRTLHSLKDSRKFLPTALSMTETETAPWVSAQVYQELKAKGKVENFTMGGFSENGQQATTLTLVEESPLVFTMGVSRVQVKTLEAATPGGDRFWILDDPTNPLVVKFQPVGTPLPGAYGTIGYQIESIEEGE